MRSSYDTEVFRNESGQIYAVGLGADFVGEHERGIKSLYGSFGIESYKVGRNPPGIESRRTGDLPGKHHRRLFIEDFNKGKKRRRGYGPNPEEWATVGWRGTLLGMFSQFDIEDGIDPTELSEMYDSVSYVLDENGKRTDTVDTKPLTSAWSDYDMAIFARKDGDIQFLKDLYHAMLSNKAAIWTGTVQNRSTRAFLFFGIIDRMPQSLIDEFERVDNDYLQLEKSDQNSGIRDRLKTAELGYYALTPKWKASIETRNIDTKHDIVYWLNPYDQKNYNIGHFTVEELDQWIAETGPIMKDKTVHEPYPK